MSYETLEPPRSDGPAEALLPGGPPEPPLPDGPVEPPRADPQISVEAAPVPSAGTPGWAEPVMTRTERRKCPHWVRFADLNTKGRTRRALAVLAIWTSWAVVVIGLFAGLAGMTAGIEKGAQLPAIGGLALACGAVLQAVSAVALASAWRRLHRPKDLVIGLAVSGFLVHLLGLALFLTIVDSKHLLLAVAAVPYALVLWQLIAFRNSLYARGTCRTHPGLPPAIRALLKDETARFRIADCPHQIAFGDLRVRYRVLSVANTFLLIGYIAAVLLLWSVPVSPPFSFEGDEFVLIALGILLPVGNLFSLSEIWTHSKRYHRVSPGMYVGAFTGYAMTLLAGLWAGLSMHLSLAVIVLTIYWASSAAYAMKHLPPRSECASLREPPPVVQRMLKA
ncbi:hypothetical protein [Glycomyces tritici]|uniref:Uncharacterized protein n=1 Tax=Glycomyces tritici TaxID=2665176 RepID=A0ABT7YR40_9ACTN|nr:hypothetical protein [Glycomyces tritici]MDN3241106.1 hypothetical protein [Glycomyces tritici]